MISMSGDSTKDGSALAAILPSLELIFKTFYFILQIIRQDVKEKSIIYLVCIPHNIKNSFINSICIYVYYLKKLTSAHRFIHIYYIFIKVYKINIYTSAQT